jgi:hypothetical protein
MPKAKKNEGTDVDLREDAKELVHAVGAYVMFVRRVKSKVDDETARKVCAQLHRVIAKCHEALAVLEEIMAARDKQSTALVGGKRRRS